MFNVGQFPASVLVRFQLTHSNHLNHELYSEPSFLAPQLYLLRHALIDLREKGNVLVHRENI